MRTFDIHLKSKSTDVLNVISILAHSLIKVLFQPIIGDACMHARLIRGYIPRNY
jgi:hypothetical protein